MKPIEFHGDGHTQWLEIASAASAAPAGEAILGTCMSLAKLLIEKNTAYGNSALSPLRIFSKAPADEQIKVRIDDKLSRLGRGLAAGEDAVVDLAGYLILLLVARNMGPP